MLCHLAFHTVLIKRARCLFAAKCASMFTLKLFSNRFNSSIWSINGQKRTGNGRKKKKNDWNWSVLVIRTKQIFFCFDFMSFVRNPMIFSRLSMASGLFGGGVEKETAFRLTDDAFRLWLMYRTAACGTAVECAELIGIAVSSTGYIFAVWSSLIPLETILISSDIFNFGSFNFELLCFRYVPCTNLITVRFCLRLFFPVSIAATDHMISTI